MIRVKVRTIFHLVEVLGGRETELELSEATTVARLLSRLGERSNEAKSALLEEGGEPRPHLRLMVNGRQIEFLAGIDTLLADGDELLVLPPAAGG